MEQQGCFLLDPTSTTEQQGVVNGPPLWQPAYLHPTPKTGNQLCLSLILFPHPSLKKKKASLSFCFLPHPLCLSLSPFISISQVWYKFLVESRLSSKTRVFCCFILGGFFVGGFYFVVVAAVLAWCLWDYSSPTRN